MNIYNSSEYKPENNNKHPNNNSEGVLDSYVIDNKFIKLLKSSVRPESLIDCALWNKWKEALANDPFMHLKVLDVSRSARMIWPTNKYDESFENYLKCSFNQAIDNLGYEARKTLIYLIAERLLAVQSIANNSDSGYACPSFLEASNCVSVLPVDTYVESPQNVKTLSNVSVTGTTKIQARLPEIEYRVEGSSAEHGVLINSIDEDICFRQGKYCLSKAAANYNDLDQAMRDSFLIEVLNCDNPEELIPVALYENWKVTIANSKFVEDTIADIANKLLLPWTTFREPENLSGFLKHDIPLMKKLLGFDRQKVRTLLACIAYTAHKANRTIFTSYLKKEAPVNVTEQNGLFNKTSHMCSAHVASTLPSQPVINQVNVEQLTDVLSSRFANGFRLNSPIEMVRFRSFFEKDVGEALTLPDEELKSSIATCGITFNGKVYAVSAQTKERIKRLAEDYFSAGAQAIFFAEFYTKNESWLFEASVVSEDMLIEVLRKLFPKLSFKQTYLGHTDASIFTVLEGEVLRVWGVDVLRTYGQLAEKLRYIPLERIKFALGQNSNFIWNSVETFSHVSKIEITDEDRQVISEAAFRECNSRGYVSIAELPFGEIVERNYQLSSTAVHNAVYRICLSDKFDIQGKIVTRKGDTLDALTIMKNYCLTIDKCSLEDLLNYEKELTGEVNRWIPLEAGNTVLVRIDKDAYVADKFVHFDDEAVDTAIELFMSGDYAPLKSFTTFGTFPHCGQVWNLFLLESYCRRFSRKFRFDTPSVNSRNAGAVIRKTCGMDYTEIMTDAVVNADVPLKDTAVGKFLYENGYTGRSTTAKVNEIIDKAKVIQKRKD